MAVTVLFVVIFAGIGIWYLWNTHGGNRELPLEGQSEQAVLALAEETAAVAEDLLEAGQVVRILSGGKYGGTISIRPQLREGKLLGFAVSMYDTGDLERALDQFLEDHPEVPSRDPEAFQKLKAFIDAYGPCYDRDRDALVYHTNNTAPDHPELRQQIAERIRRRLSRHPMAELEGDLLIHTKFSFGDK